jgi:hypothetical protein
MGLVKRKVSSDWPYYVGAAVLALLIAVAVKIIVGL